jgi:hypothetical protein
MMFVLHRKHTPPQLVTGIASLFLNVIKCTKQQSRHFHIPEFWVAPLSPLLTWKLMYYKEHNTWNPRAKEVSFVLRKSVMKHGCRLHCRNIMTDSSCDTFRSWAKITGGQRCEVNARGSGAGLWRPLTGTDHMPCGHAVQSGVTRTAGIARSYGLCFQINKSHSTTLNILHIHTRKKTVKECSLLGYDTVWLL